MWLSCRFSSTDPFPLVVCVQLLFVWHVCVLVCFFLLGYGPHVRVLRCFFCSLLVRVHLPRSILVVSVCVLVLLCETWNCTLPSHGTLHSIPSLVSCFSRTSPLVSGSWALLFLWKSGGHVSRGRPKETRQGSFSVESSFDTVRTSAGPS